MRKQPKATKYETKKKPKTATQMRKRWSMERREGGGGGVGRVKTRDSKTVKEGE